MKILVIGGTRFMGIHLVEALIHRKDEVTVATRGKTSDSFGDSVKRIQFDRFSRRSISEALTDQEYDVIYDSLAYASEDVRILLESVHCRRYIMISSTAVYDKHINTVENEFDADEVPVKWGSRKDFSYDEGKRNAERALVQCFGDISSIRVRFPFVIGMDDYTGRMDFYVQHILEKKAMHIDDFENQMAFIDSKEAGEFLAYLSKTDFVGCINGASPQTASLRDICDYITKKTGYSAVLSEKGEEAPYNGENAYSINTDRAAGLGFLFSPLPVILNPLLDRLIFKNK
jgi:nucleoside-diphosphate-sugar epimerase